MDTLYIGSEYFNREGDGRVIAAWRRPEEDAWNKTYGDPLTLSRSVVRFTGLPGKKPMEGMCTVQEFRAWLAGDHVPRNHLEDLSLDLTALLSKYMAEAQTPEEFLQVCTVAHGLHTATQNAKGVSSTVNFPGLRDPFNGRV